MFMAGGRPRIYDDPEVLETACDEFFVKCKEEKKRPTVTGLALWLGFADKSTLYEYRDRPEFSYPIKKSLTMIENELESRLDLPNVAGTIFGLKNMGWVDKIEANLNHSGSVIWNETRTYDPDQKANTGS